MLESEEKAAQLERVTEQLKELSLEELSHAETFLANLYSKKERPFNHYLGKFLDIDEEAGLFKMKLGKQQENIHGVAQGGAVLTLADIAIGYHLIQQLPKEVKVFTLELKLNFIKGGAGTHLSAKPNILHIGGTTAVTECDVIDDQGDLVAKALGTFYIKR